MHSIDATKDFVFVEYLRPQRTLVFNFQIRSSQNWNKFHILQWDILYGI